MSTASNPNSSTKSKLDKAKDHYTPVDWRNFALINNTSLIKFTSYDNGGQSFNIIKAYLSYLDLLKHVGCYFPLENEVQMIKDITTVLQGTKDILSGYPYAIFGKLSQTLLEFHSTQLLRQIGKSLDRDGFTYFLLGYCGKKDEPGHALACKVSRDKERNITLQFFNRGEGANHHPTLDTTNTSELSSYSYYPVTLSQKEWDERAEPFFCHLFRFLADTPEEKTMSYSSVEFYDLLKILGPISPSLILQQAEQLKCKFQYIGDCSEKAVKTILLDYLRVQKSYSPETVKKVFLNIHLASVLSGYFSLKAAPHVHHQELLIHACEEFGAHLLRCKADLQKENFLETGDILDHVLKEVTSLPPPKETTVSIAYEEPSTLLPSLPLPQTLTIGKPNVEKIPSIDHFSFPQLNPLTFNQELKAFIKWCENKKTNEILYTFILSLPLPRDSQNPLWDKVPEKDIGPILLNFKRLIPNWDNSIPVLAGLTLYCIADYLVRRISNVTKLDDCSSPFPKSFIENKLVYLPNEELRYLKIEHYFIETQKKALKLAQHQIEQNNDYCFRKCFVPHSDYLKKFCPNETSIQKFTQFVPTETLLLIDILNLAFLRFNPKPFVSENPNDKSLWDHEYMGINDFLLDHTFNSGDSELNELIISEKNFDNLIKRKKQQQDKQRIEEKNARFEINAKKDLEPHELKKEELESVKKNVQYFNLIFQHRPLQIGLGLNWLYTHIKELRNPEIQKALEYCFFSPRSLREQCMRGPETVLELQSFLDKSLEEYAGNPDFLPITLFLIRTLAVLDCHFGMDNQNTKSFEKYKLLLRKILSTIKYEKGEQEERSYSDTFVHLIFIHSLTQENSEESLVEICQDIFTLGTHIYDSVNSAHDDIEENASFFLSNQLHFFYCKTLQRLHSFLSQQKNPDECLSRICNQIMTHVLKSKEKVEEKWSWNGSFSNSISNRYVLNFLKGSIFHPRFGGRLIHPQYLDRKEREMQKFGIAPFEKLWSLSLDVLEGKKKNIYQLFLPLDENTYFVSHFIGAIYQVIEKNEKAPSQTIALFNEDAIKKFPVLKQNNLVHYLQNPPNNSYFSFLSSQTTSFFSYKQNPLRPFVRIDFESKGLSVTRLNEKGEPLPWKFVNLEKLDPKHPLFAYTLRVANHSEIICFINEASNEIEELTFPSLSLSFTNQNGSLLCHEFPGYSFVTVPIKAFSFAHSNVIVLRHTSQKIKVLLLAPEEKRHLGKSEKEDPILREKFEVYDLDTIHDEIKCKTLSQSLFFIYFLKANGEHKKAWEELKKISHLHFDKKTCAILRLFLDLLDNSPYSLAFNLKLLAFVANHIPLAAEKSDSDMEAIRSFFKKSIDWYVDYLRVAEDDDVNGIPYEFRLKEEEESTILSTFVREEITLPKILVTREELLHTIERKAVHVFKPQTLTSAPLKFSYVSPPEELISLAYYLTVFPYGVKAKDHPEIAYPNRFSEEYFEANFLTLYDRAKKASQKNWDPFDFTLLTCLQVNKKLGSLLFYVRYFPEAFQDLSFSLLSKPSDVFKEIVQQASQLHEGPDFAKRMEKIMGNTSFDLQKTRVLQLPPATTSTLTYPEPKPLKIEKRPFGDLFNSLFTESKNEEQLPPLFEIASKKTLAEDLHQKLKTAQEYLNQHPDPIYTVNPKGFTKAKNDLKKLHDGYLSEKNASEKKILDWINTPYQSFKIEHSMDEKEYRLRLNARQTYLITAEDLMKKVILAQSMELFAAHRPMLNKDQAEKILAEVHNYYHLSVLSMLVKEASQLIEKLEKNPADVLTEKDLFSILNYQFLYAPEQFPEIAFMKVKMGKHPRPEQIKVYLWLCEGVNKQENRLFQLQAGGGKSSYLIPLLILRLKRYAVTPLILVTSAMYPTESENLGNTLALLGEKLDAFQISMNEDLPLKKLQIIYQKLKKSRILKTPFILTSQTLYALRLKYYALAIEEQTSENVKCLQNISLFLRKNGFLLGDESHRNFDPMTQAVFGMGAFYSLAHHEHALLLELMKPLMGITSLICENGKELAKVAKTEQNHQRLLEKEEILLLQKTLAHYAASYLELKPTQELMDFWIHKGDLPAFVSGLKKEEKEAILLAHYFLNHLVPHILKMKTDFDHLLSKQQGNIDTPSYHKNPSHAQYKDPYLACCLTIKGIWHRGLNEEQLKMAIEKLKADDEEEKGFTAYDLETPSFCRFEKWEPSLNLRSVELSDPKLFSALFSKLKKHPDVIEYYLTAESFAHIGYSSEQFISTPAHLMDVKGSILFSATPLIQDIYPNALHEACFDDLFVVKVALEASKKKNQNFIFPNTVEHFFKHLDENKASLEQVRYMIDSGGFLCDELNENVAKMWLKNSNLDGVIYFKDMEDELTSSENNGNNLVYLSSNPKTSFEFSGTDDLKQKFKNRELEFDSLKIGFFYDSAHAESANFPPIPHTSAFVFDGDSLTFSHAIQGIMRARGFLDPKINQTLIWVVQSELQKKRQGKNATFHSQMILSASFKNEVKGIKRNVLMKGFQEISFQIEKAALASKPKQLEAIKTHAKGFRETVNPLIGNPKEKLEKTDVVFGQFAKSFYGRFSFTESLEKNEKLNKDLSITIKKLDDKIPKVMANFQEKAVMEVHQKCVVKKEAHKIEFPRNLANIVPIKLKKSINLSDPSYSLPSEEFSVQQIFKTPHLTENFFFEWNHLHTGESMGIALKEKLLKPIDFLLVVSKDQKVWAEAVSNDILEDYIYELDSKAENSAIKHKAFIIKSNGVVYHAGIGTLALKKEEIEKILNSDWLHDVLIDVALLNGLLPNNARFQERKKKWSDFHLFWGNVLKAQSIRKDYSLRSMSAYLTNKTTINLNSNQ